MLGFLKTLNPRPKCEICGKTCAVGARLCQDHLNPGRNVVPMERYAEEAAHRPAWKVFLVVLIVVLVVYAVGTYVWNEIAVGLVTSVVTLEEYAEQVCGYERLPPGSTWGEAADHLRARISVHKRLDPPEEIRDYHRTLIVSLEGALQAVSEQHADAKVDEFAMLFSADAMRAVQVLEVAEGELSGEARRVLRRHGCDV